MNGFKIIFCSSKFPWEGGIIYFIFIGNLGTRPQTFRQPLSSLRAGQWWGYDRKGASQLPAPVF
jgi:hypothetical protein